MSAPLTHTFSVVTASASSPAQLFDLSCRPSVHVDSLEGSGETYRASAEILGLGDEVEFTARHLGRTWTLRSRVTAYDYPSVFVDEQVTGPFQSFRHEHRFEARHEGCVMTDTVAFEAPLGQLGRLASGLVLGPYLRRLIRRRARYLAALRH